MAVQLLAVAVDADIDPGLGQQGSVERNRIVGLDLVGPPVRERGGAGTVVADLGGDLVALEDVLERLDLDAVALGGAQQHQDLVAAVAMTVNLDRSLDDLGQGLEPKIPARGRTGLVLVLLPGLLVALPFRKVGLALLERPLDHRLDAHPRIGKSTLPAGHVLTQGELYSLGGIADYELTSRLAVAQLDHGVLPPDRVGRAVQQPGGRRTAGQGPIDRHIIARDHVLDAHLGNDRQAELVDTPLDGDMGMGVDNSGHGDEPCRLDHGDSRLGLHAWPHGRDLAVLDEYRAAGDGSLRDGQDRRILDQHAAAGLDLRRAIGIEFGGHVNEWLGRSLFLGAGRPGTGRWATAPSGLGLGLRAGRRQSRLGLGFRGRLSAFGLCLCWRSGRGLGLRGLLSALGRTGALRFRVGRWGARVGLGGIRAVSGLRRSLPPHVRTCRGIRSWPARRIARSCLCVGSRFTPRPPPRREGGRPSPAPGSGALTSNSSPSISTNRAFACSSWNGAENATRWPSLPGSSVPSFRSRPAMVAAWVVSAASAWSAVRPLAIRARSCAGKLSSRSRPSVAKANGIPARARAAAVATCSFHLSRRWASSFSGSSCSSSGRLRYSSSVGTLGSSGKLSGRMTATCSAFNRSATLAASRPPTMTTVVPNSAARSSARWISSRVSACHHTGSFRPRACHRVRSAGS